MRHYLLILTGAMLLSACNREVKSDIPQVEPPTCDRFVGRWQSDHYWLKQVDIEKNESIYVLSINDANGGRHIMSCNNGAMSSDGNFPGTIALVSNNTILLQGREYSKVVR